MLRNRFLDCGTLRFASHPFARNDGLCGTHRFGGDDIWGDFSLSVKRVVVCLGWGLRGAEMAGYVLISYVTGWAVFIGLWFGFLFCFGVFWVKGGG